MRIGDRSPARIQTVTTVACAVTVSVTVSGPTFRRSAAQLAETPWLL